MLVRSRLSNVRYSLASLAVRAVRGQGRNGSANGSRALGVAPTSDPDLEGDVGIPAAASPQSRAGAASPLAREFEPDTRSIDDETLRAEIADFLDRVEARELARVSARRGRPPAADGEADRVLEAARDEAAELVRRAHGEAEQRLEWARAQSADILRRSQRLAAARFQGAAPAGPSFEIDSSP